MNFKKYHQSKNLCEINGFISDETEQKLLQTVVLNAGTYTYSCMQNDTLSSNTRNCLMIRIGQAAYTYESTQSNYHLSAGKHTMTFTVPDDNTSVELRYWINTFSNTCSFDNFMLNTGSTALPYEPYGDTWHDIPYYQHKTATDTLTTLPADIYANDNNATVGLKGDMEQSGTPSPTTPIQPSECGERTGNLFDYTKTDGIIANKYINQSGAIVADNEYYISYPIKVDVGETYTWRFDSNSSAAGHTAPTVGFYDSSDNLLSTAQHNVTVKYFSFEVPTNCAYIRASVFTRSNAQKEAMLNAGSTPLPYEPYGYFIEIEVS